MIISSSSPRRLRLHWFDGVLVLGAVSVENTTDKGPTICRRFGDGDGLELQVRCFHKFSEVVFVDCGVCAGGVRSWVGIKASPPTLDFLGRFQYATSMTIAHSDLAELIVHRQTRVHRFL